MGKQANIKLYAINVDCLDPHALAEFYAQLLGWEIVYEEGDFSCIGVAGAGQGTYPGMIFQLNSEYVPPVWPEKEGAQQQMEHMDFAVDDIAQAAEHALRCGATEAAEQFSDSWRVMIDPAGHPFCLCDMKAVMESAEFALR